MFHSLLPQTADSRYRGRRSALVLLALILLMKLGIALGTIFNGRGAATSADGIPIDSYGPAGASTVLSLFALLGLANVIIVVVGAIVLLRYRALVPLIFVLLLLQQAGRYAVLAYLPIARTGAPPGSVVNMALLALLAVGLLLSLTPRAVGSGNSGSRG